MSKQGVQAFRDKVSQIPALQQQVRSAIESGEDLSAAVALGQQYGCEFTREEAQEVLQCVRGDELSDFELELVAGGSTKPPPSGGKSPTPGKGLVVDVSPKKNVPLDKLNVGGGVGFIGW